MRSIVHTFNLQRNEDFVLLRLPFHWWGLLLGCPVITNFDCSHLMLRKCAMGAEMCLELLMTTASVMWATWCYSQAMDTQQLFLAALRSFSRKTKKTMKWECGPLGMRDVKDRHAELRMEWDSDYTIAVAEYSSWAEEASWGVQGPEVKINVETMVFFGANRTRWKMLFKLRKST